MRKKTELPEVEPVRLKPVSGIRPGIFILGGIILSVIVLFFLLCVLPGLLSGTGYVRFVTNTANTAIMTDDGRYIGSSEGSMYRLDAGEYRFVFYVNGVEAGSVEATVPHRVFFTLFTHRTDTISFEAENSPEIEEAVRKAFAEGSARWSAVIDYDDTYHFPPLFSSFAINAVALGFDDISSLLLYGALHITSQAMYLDYIEALSCLEGSQVRYMSEELEELSTILSSVYGGNIPERKRTTAVSDVHCTYDNGYFSYEPSIIEMGEDSLLSYPECNVSPVTVATEAFSISENPVTEYEYALFVEANPYWSRANLETLISDGVADEGYLEGVTLSPSIMSSRPVRSISYFAAEAYCDWLSDITGDEYSLPSEAEWYTAALSAADKEYATSLIHLDFDTTSPSSMMGGLWEMTSTPYLPLMRISDYQNAIELGSLYPYDDIIVKGGSYINASTEINAESVGVAQRSATSPFIGFRIVRK